MFTEYFSKIRKINFQLGMGCQTKFGLLKAMQTALLLCFQLEKFYKNYFYNSICRSRGGGGGGGGEQWSRPPLKIHKNIGFLSNIGLDP